jgi:hypothetical protein
VGQIMSGRGMITEANEGACVRWKVEHGKAWLMLGGHAQGQTQLGYPALLASDDIPFNHPLDLHFAEAGLQVRVFDT